MISKCCIFIDADPYNQAMFSSALDELSPDTICFNVSSSSDAMSMIEAEGLMPSYIFLEFNSHERESLEFLSSARKNPDLRDTPIIVHATSPLPHYILQLLESGASAIYYKPYHYKDIVNMLSLYFSSSPAGIQPN